MLHAVCCTLSSSFSNFFNKWPLAQQFAEHGDCVAGMVPLMVVYFFLQKYYRRSYVELQRCDATSRSPVYAHFSESLTGVETIRAFAYQEKFASKSDGQIDYNHR